MTQLADRRRALLRALQCGILGAAACVLVACDDDESARSALPEAREVPGGGVTGEALAQRLTVVVIDAVSGRRVPDAVVERASERERANRDGVAQIDVGSARPVVVSVSAPGYVPTTWQGGLGSMLTVPLVPSGYRAPHAIVGGTLEGWETLQPSGPGRYLVARFDHSRRPDLDSIDTAILHDASEQVTCTKRDGAEPCAFSLRVPLSRRTVFVTIAEADDRGTANDTSDDAFAVIAMGLTSNLSLTAGGATQNLRLPFRLAVALGRVTVDLTRRPNLPADVVGLPGLNAGGEVLLFDAFWRAPEFLVPTRSDLPDAKLWSVATDAVDGVRLRSFVRGVDLPDAGQSIRLQSGALRAAPMVTVTDGGRVVIDGAAGLVQVRAARQGELTGVAVLLSAPYEVTLPEGAAPDSITVTAYESPLDPAEMSLQTVRERAASLAERTIAP
jgi:hypothetical protein